MGAGAPAMEARGWLVVFRPFYVRRRAQKKRGLTPGQSLLLRRDNHRQASPRSLRHLCRACEQQSQRSCSPVTSVAKEMHATRGAGSRLPGSPSAAQRSGNTGLLTTSGWSDSPAARTAARTRAAAKPPSKRRARIVCGVLRFPQLVRRPPQCEGGEAQRGSTPHRARPLPGMRSSRFGTTRTRRRTRSASRRRSALSRSQSP